ncbi:5-dehydro-4-deoxyglucarate dehydratase [Humibacter ginsenosidimutans]|uniref:Probable 5-dehydro-4-deoxyglucarate dehydratase n=1 Tax=Humibacter ginsenosidimutans TaxID=2599293 RepID=A0A5B8M6B3_9MICO|nr:5-dehydro-4-deoxyglucarate dehydratase [Humibacter ginsenosidimutans]QDZ15721.1 5-dehydro-4-deoxyglucarate dehydratase [Humibacter ginsenosidimutans]
MRFDGVLFFPVTAYAADGSVDAALTAEHVASRLPHAPGGVFPACGTGEFHALSASEVGEVVKATVETVNGAVPVVSGAGGPLGHAIECAKRAADAGADALLVLPPYLVAGPVSGTAAYVEALLAASDLPAIVYHRGSAQLNEDAATRLAQNPRVIGFKDGVGDLGVAQQLVRAAAATDRDDLTFFNGLPTAELTQQAYRAIGVPLYSSAAFAMAPRVAKAFYEAYASGDDARRIEILDAFYLPLVRLRDETPGFAVSLVKAGVRLDGLPVGGVRPPLVDPTPRQLDELTRILAIGDELVGGA